MYPRTAFRVLVLAASLSARDRIAYIEFFGYQGIDTRSVRNALPVSEGDRISDDIRDRIRVAVKRAAGFDANDVTSVCCTSSGDSVVFISLPGASSRALKTGPAPRGNAAPPPELVSLSRAANQAEIAAIQKGLSGEDGSPGYRLLKEPAAHAAELALRDYALKHEADIIRVLESCGQSEQRAVAAEALGYGARSGRQISALVRSARDPAPEVRNNAARALGEILRADPSAAAQVQPENFIDMVRSPIWSDRNKASVVLMQLTESRGPRLLESIRSEVEGPLWEMARWRAAGWAYPARVVLGRMAGLPEERVRQLAEGSAEEFAAALGR